METPAMLAAKNGHLEMLKFLHEKGAQNLFSCQNMKMAKKRMKKSLMMSDELSTGADFSPKGQKSTSPLLCAAEGGHVEVMEFLLSVGIPLDVNDVDDKTAVCVVQFHVNTYQVYHAAISKKLNVLKFLHEKGAQNVKSYQTLLDTVESGDRDSILFAISIGCHKMKPEEIAEDSIFQICKNEFSARALVESGS